MYSNRPYPAIQTYTIKPGSPPVYGSSSGGYCEVERTDTIRRKKPSPLNETSVSTSVSDVRHHPLTTSKNGYVYCLSSQSLGFTGRPQTGKSYSNNIIVAENRLRANARSSGVNLAMMMAEYRQTAMLFIELSAQAVKLYRSVRRGRFKGALDSYRLSKDWLRFQYGVRPLMSDLYGSYQELQNAKVHSPLIRSGSTTRTHYQKKTTFFFREIVGDFFAEQRVTCRARVRFNESFFTSFATRHGLTNPVALAWDLIPFSFVVDWWINVGETLESLDNCLVFSSLTGSTSQKIDEIVTAEGELLFRYRQTSRTTKSFSLTNGLVYKPSVSLTHILNGLALWRSIR